MTNKREHCVDPFQRQPVHGELAYFRSYILFNNISMFEDAMRFKEMMGNG